MNQEERRQELEPHFGDDFAVDTMYRVNLMTDRCNIRFMWKYVLIAVVLVISGCGTVDTASRRDLDAKVDLAVGAYNVTAEKKEKLVCRYEIETGSHFKRKVCRTVAQIEKDREEARKTLKKSSIARGTGDN